MKLIKRFPEGRKRTSARDLLETDAGVAESFVTERDLREGDWLAIKVLLDHIYSEAVKKRCLLVDLVKPTLAAHIGFPQATFNELRINDEVWGQWTFQLQHGDILQRGPLLSQINLAAGMKLLRPDKPLRLYSGERGKIEEAILSAELPVSNELLDYVWDLRILFPESRVSLPKEFWENVLERLQSKRVPGSYHEFAELAAKVKLLAPEIFQRIDGPNNADWQGMMGALKAVQDKVDRQNIGRASRAQLAELAMNLRLLAYQSRIDSVGLIQVEKLVDKPISHSRPLPDRSFT